MNMTWKVDDRIPEDLFVKLMIEKANIIKDHLKKSMHPLIIVANIGPTLAVFKFYDTNEEDFLKLHMTLSNIGDMMNKYMFCGSKLQLYCSQCGNHNSSESNVNVDSNGQ